MRVKRVSLSPRVKRKIQHVHLDQLAEEMRPKETSGTKSSLIATISQTNDTVLISANETETPSDGVVVGFTQRPEDLAHILCEGRLRQQVLKGQCPVSGGLCFAKRK